MINPLAWWNGLGRPLARLPRWAAMALIAALIAGVVWSSFAVAPVAQAEVSRAESSENEGDRALYQRISERVATGESYYAAAVDEQRTRNYPTRPFVTVRLPTLAWLHSLIGASGVRIASMLLLLACLWGLNQRLEGRTDPLERTAAVIMLALGGAAVAGSQSGYVHEVTAGILLTLAFVLYTPQRWWPSLIAAGVALAVREIAAPFVLLWLAFAVMEKRWREAAALCALLLVFAVGMYLHYLGVEAYQQAGDPASQGWDGMLGPALPLMAMSRLTALLVLPVTYAAPFALLALVGWLGLGGRMGLFATLWFFGMFAAMALFARPENFYWAQLVLPAYFAGLALVPHALADIGSSLWRKERQS